MESVPSIFHAVQKAPPGQILMAALVRIQHDISAPPAASWVSARKERPVRRNGRRVRLFRRNQPADKDARRVSTQVPRRSRRSTRPKMSDSVKVRPEELREKHDCWGTGLLCSLRINFLVGDMETTGIPDLELRFLNFITRRYCVSLS